MESDVGRCGGALRHASGQGMAVGAFGWPRRVRSVASGDARSIAGAVETRKGPTSWRVHPLPE